VLEDLMGTVWEECEARGVVVRGRAR
jgi:hypothetical protein